MKLIETLKKIRRAFSRFPDKLLHSFRQAAARRALRGGNIPRSVLFVCHGNICRSPYAVVAARHRLPEPLRNQVRLDSAGFVGPNRRSPPEAVSVAGSRGLDLTPHRSKLLSADLVRGADLVGVMEAAQRDAILREFGALTGPVVVLGDLDPQPISSRDILDPYDQKREVFEESFDRIDRCLDVLLRLAISGGIDNLARPR